MFYFYECGDVKLPNWTVGSCASWWQRWFSQKVRNVRLLMLKPKGKRNPSSGLNPRLNRVAGGKKFDWLSMVWWENVMNTHQVLPRCFCVSRGSEVLILHLEVVLESCDLNLDMRSMDGWTLKGPYQALLSLFILIKHHNFKQRWSWLQKSQGLFWLWSLNLKPTFFFSEHPVQLPPPSAPCSLRCYYPKPIRDIITSHVTWQHRQLKDELRLKTPRHCTTLGWHKSKIMKESFRYL